MTLWWLAVFFCGILIGTLMPELSQRADLRSSAKEEVLLPPEASSETASSPQDRNVQQNSGERMRKNDTYKALRRRFDHATPYGTYDITLFYRLADIPAAADMPNITFVSHVTVDRLPHVRRWCRSWLGPMSISVFVRPFVDDVATVLQNFADDLCICKYAHLHVVTEKGHWYDPTGHAARNRGGAKDMMVHYPSNVQRNVALDGCMGELALLMDIDFHLQPQGNQQNSEESLRRHFLAEREQVAGWTFLGGGRNMESVRDAAMYVVAAVETVSKDIAIPTSLPELAAKVEAHQACEFYGHYCHHCHHPTNLRKFLTASSPYLIEYEDLYEPYVIVNRSSIAGASPHEWRLPRYNESFVGRFGDKNSFFMEVAAQRRAFIVLSRYFLVHHGRGDDVKWPAEPSTEYRVRERQYERNIRDFRALLSLRYAQDTGAKPENRIEQPQSAAERHHSSTVAAESASSRRDPWYAVHDALLHDATRSIDWAAVSSDGRGLLRGLQALRADTNSEASVTRGLTCIASYRHLVDNPREYDAEVLQGIESLQQAVSWVCGHGLDCSPLQPGGIRQFPTNLVAQADWIFARWLSSAPKRGESIASACHFNGAGRFSSLDGVESPFASGALLSVENADLIGCTLNPNFLVNAQRLQELVHEICAEPPNEQDAGTRMAASEEDFDDWFEQRLKQPRIVHDRVGGDCRVLFDKIHPLVRHDLRVKASVALNAHHLIFLAGGEGKTCRMRFGDIAAYWKAEP